MTTIRVSLLKGFELAVGDEIADLPQASQRVIAFIACRDRPVQRAFVAGNLWLDRKESRAGANLRSALWRLGDVASGLIESVGASLRLGSNVRVDLREATCAARKVIDGTPLDVNASEATTLLSGDLLPDWYDDWLVMNREQFRQQRLHALETLAKRLVKDGRAADAVDAAMAAVAAEPLRESSNRVLVAAHLAEGNACEALRHFAVYRRLLLDELGLSPSPAMDRLVAPITRPMMVGVRQT